ncbi:hypothetical protein [Desulfogranum marinum]|uniref:hypothetical protein n=1 Tax=Desulfogranum marinum TaxID=453220 RepID=UPI0019668AAE|nr:hypothetical protein [Desulfogranum marinum]MBM9513782.1 hypothetical protein [Desulfogranum marinum]
MRLLDGSGVNREVHAPFCERLEVRFLRPTHHETFNTLKNQGYHFEHNYGLGKQHLSTVFVLLMILAFLVDQIQQLCCQLFNAALKRARGKKNFWDWVRSLFRVMMLDSMEQLYRVILNPEPQKLSQVE